jgi:hypothetical protein
VWLSSRGQIDFYDQSELIGAAADAIVNYFVSAKPSPMA